MDFDSIWNEYRGSLEAYLNSRVSDPQEVQDLLQLIFLKVFESHHLIKSSKSTKAWLYQVTKNATVDYYRKTGRPLKEAQSSSWYSTLDADAIDGLSQCIAPFITCLPKESSSLLRAIDLGGESQKNYAMRTGTSYSTVKSRVQKARAQLKQLFIDCCHYSIDHQGNIMGFDPKEENCKNC